MSMKLSKEYIAGFVDGEGYLGIIRKSSKECQFGYYYTPVVKIAQVTRNDQVLKSIEDFIGYGNTTYDIREVENSCPRTYLELRGMKRIKPFVKKIQPYLVVKNKQAQILLDFCNLPSVSNKNAKEIDEIRTKMWEEIKYLNRRGLAETKRKEDEKSMR